MSTKSCPSCGAVVPESATRCKDCHHDFNELPRPKSSPIALLIAAAVIAVCGAAFAFYIQAQPIEQRAFVDAETQTVQWFSRFRDDSVETRQLRFDEISKIRYVAGQGGSQLIIAVTLTGDEEIIKEDPNNSLRMDAQSFAEMMNKPLETVNNGTLASGK